MKIYQVIRKIKGFYYVCEYNDKKIDFSNIIECRLKGNLKQKNSKFNCVVGDFVNISDDFVINNINERKNIFERPLIANVDNIFLTFSVSFPDFDELLFQKILLYIDKSKANYSLILTKCDLISEKDLSNLISNIKEIKKDINILKKYKDSDLENIILEINKYRTNLFTGPSGVGKSTLLKNILNDYTIDTDEISKKLKKGKNTTVESRFYNFNNKSIVIDTPGFSNLFFPKLENYEEIYEYFPEYLEFLGCKFSDCKHNKEIGCLVKKAVENKEISDRRYNFYLNFLNQEKENEYE